MSCSGEEAADTHSRRERGGAVSEGGTGIDKLCEPDTLNGKHRKLVLMSFLLPTGLRKDVMD